MTSILPQIDSLPLFHFVDFNEPWDSAKNAGLFLTRYPVFENPSELKPIGHWEFPVIHYSANPHIMAVNSFTKPQSIKNPQRVFLVGELDGDFLPWGCPYNWRELDRLNSNPPTYGRHTRDGCQFLFVDGRVEFVSNEISPALLKQMNGDDLTEFKTDSPNIQRPSAFPCPVDALSVGIWSSDSNRGELILQKRDIHGNVKSEERR